MTLPFPHLPTTECVEPWEPEGLRRWLPSWIGSDWFEPIIVVKLGKEPVSREILARIGRLPHLEYLELRHSEVQLNDLESLAGCRSLKYLHLYGEHLGNVHVRFPSDLPALEELILSGTDVDDRGLESISHLHNLRRLWVTGAQEVTSDGVASLAKCTRLEELNLARTKADDGALWQLLKLPNLRTLDVEFTSVTATGVNRFREARPNCRVYWNEPF
jgi:Leucine-rich repeat (LRR) protein